ncbi:MAG: hypothetical protein AAGB51_06230 [Planctomycetota bacterium]
MSPSAKSKLSIATIVAFVGLGAGLLGFVFGEGEARGVAAQKLEDVTVAMGRLQDSIATLNTSIGEYNAIARENKHRIERNESDIREIMQLLMLRPNGDQP